MATRTSLKHHFSEFIGLIVIAVCISALSVVKLDAKISLFLGTFISASIPAYRKGSDIIRQIDKRRSRRKEIREITDSFLDQIESLKISSEDKISQKELIEGITDKDVSRNKASIFQFGIRQFFPSLDENEKYIFNLILILFHLVFNSI